MNTTLETKAAVESVPESVRQASDGKADGPPAPAWVRGACPLCGAPVVSNAYYVGGRGYKILFECWESLRATPACTYRQAL